MFRSVPNLEELKRDYQTVIEGISLIMSHNE